MLEHPASRALRARSSQLFRQLLIADLSEEFRGAAAEGPSGLRAIVQTFGERRDVTLASFHCSLAETPAGPSYRRSASMSGADLRELLDRLGED